LQMSKQTKIAEFQRKPSNMTIFKRDWKDTFTFFAEEARKKADEADGLREKSEHRSQMFGKMAASVHSVPSDILTELDLMDGDMIFSFLLRQMENVVVPSFADAHHLMLTMLDELKRPTPS